MSLDKLRARRRLDWIRIGFILKSKGDLSLDELTFTFNKMFHNGKTNREVARIMMCYSRYGFESRAGKTVTIYSFTGDLEFIHPRTIQRWIEKIETL
jgi:hypothetical protein